ncbi:hypothetical protein [Agromyces aureus]|uniref:ABC transporter domain-containing protein n=1 Tax=Agromyces aureus TaxID=453304 RepID=A0A191WFX0_9MICO|nr:hypothetical protein ATC03_10670 [Agromyces aureus]
MKARAIVFSFTASSVDQSLAEGRTTLIVAHRLSQAASADRIVVMDRGRICEQGTHAGLVAAGRSYARLWAAWIGARTSD